MGVLTCLSIPMAKAMKAMKAMKAKTVGGLTADMLIKNKRGKVVSKRQSAAGKRAYKNIKAWTEAMMSARRALHVQGFHAMNGKSLQGKALYFKTKSFFQGSADQTA